MALASVALIGAGLFVRSFRNVQSVHPGFESAKVLFGRFWIESANYTTPQIQQSCARLREILKASPGVEAVSYSNSPRSAPLPDPTAGFRSKATSRLPASR